MKAKEQRVPVLRFPGFEGEWPVKKAKNIFLNSRSKGNDSLPIYSVLQGRGLVPRNTINRKMQNDATPESHLRLDSKDLAYNMMRMWQGAVGIADRECMVSPAYIVLKPKKDISSDFFIHFFFRARSLYLFTSYSYGLTSDRLRLYYKDFSSIKFATPSLSEQQKIASFLTAVDTKIEQLSRKKALLEQYKKGMMQKLFSQELRFKDEQGNDFPDWEEKRLKDVASIIMGTSPKSEAYNDQAEGLPLIQGNADIKNRKSAPRIFTSVVTKECLPNDILLSVRAPVGEVSTSRHHACIGRGMSAIRATSLNNQEFIFHFLLWFEPRWKGISQGSTFESVNTKDIKLLKVPMPRKEEQQKIATFLFSIDQKINLISTELEKAQTFKKGLLQQMFV